MLVREWLLEALGKIVEFESVTPNTLASKILAEHVLTEEGTKPGGPEARKV